MTNATTEQDGTQRTMAALCYGACRISTEHDVEGCTLTCRRCQKVRGWPIEDLPVTERGPLFAGDVEPARESQQLPERHAVKESRDETADSAYRVEPAAPACVGCGRNHGWDVIGPDGFALGVTFDDREKAEQFADDMNSAYAKGREAGLAAEAASHEQDAAHKDAQIERMERELFRLREHIAGVANRRGDLVAKLEEVASAWSLETLNAARSALADAPKGETGGGHD